ncbi:type 2 periplasmic-binding domain-containing protein [Alkalihalobacterium elongatum]|uniref:hypothetical protein n=1 Tax=Alkalihalobacterium elongatum TaxID=2675466 RepID=UPI001C1FD4B8|nr:hypothetical protein [Alkalihalobacterium elongatum]
MKIYIKGLLYLSILISIFIITACGNDQTVSENKVNVEEAEPIHFRASSGISEQHFFHRGFITPLFERLENETDGALSFEVFSAGELVPLGSEYDALRQGTIDIGLTLSAVYDPQRFPYSEVVMLPLLESNSNIIANAVQKMAESDREISDGKTYYELEFGDKDLVVFFLPPTEPYVISTTKHKFDTVEDFNASIRMRTPSRVHEILASNLGLTSLSMPITDAYDALSRNALDGLFYNVPDWKAIGLDELIKYTIEGVNLGHFVNQIAMTQETWDKIPKDIQEKFRNAANEIIYDGAQLTMNEMVENKENNIEKGGEFIHINELNSEARDIINSAVVDTWHDWIENLESENLAGKEMAILWRDMLVEAGATLPDEIMELK